MNHEVHPFRVCSSVDISLLYKLVTTVTIFIIHEEIFSPLRVTNLPLSLAHLEATAYMFSIDTDFPILKQGIKLNHMIHGLFSLNYALPSIVVMVCIETPPLLY